MKKLLLLPLVFLMSCRQGPLVTVCVSDVQSGGLACFDQRLQRPFFLKFQDSEKYVCLPPADAQALFAFCANGKQPNAETKRMIEFLKDHQSPTEWDSEIVKKFLNNNPESS